MRNNKWKIASFVAIGVGVILVVIGLLWGGYPGIYVDADGVHGMSQIRETESVLQEKTSIEAFEEADIKIGYTNVEIIPSDDFYIEYAFAQKEDEPMINVKDGKLTIREKNRVYLFNFSINFGIGSVTKGSYLKLYIPKEQLLTKVVMNIEDGSLNADGVKANRVELKAEYGDVNWSNFQGEELSIKQNDGKLTLDHAKAANIEIENEYGDSNLSGVTAQNIKMNCNDGKLKLEEIDSDNLDIQNEYGDIVLGLTRKLTSYNLQLSTEYGDIKIPETKISSESDEQSYNVDNKSQHLIRIHCEDGNIQFKTK